MPAGGAKLSSHRGAPASRHCRVSGATLLLRGFSPGCRHPSSCYDQVVYSTGDLRQPRVMRLPYLAAKKVVDFRVPSDLWLIPGLPNGY